MSLAQLFYCREAIRNRVKRWHEKKPRPAMNRFTLETLEPRGPTTIPLGLCNFADVYQSIRLYVDRHQGRNVITQDLMTAIEETTGQNLDWFWKSWSDGTTLSPSSRLRPASRRPKLAVRPVR